MTKLERVLLYAAFGMAAGDFLGNLALALLGVPL
jgi:hypothetical protein